MYFFVIFCRCPWLCIQRKQKENASLVFTNPTYVPFSWLAEQGERSGWWRQCRTSGNEEGACGGGGGCGDSDDDDDDSITTTPFEFSISFSAVMGGGVSKIAGGE